MTELLLVALPLLLGVAALWWIRRRRVSTNTDTEAKPVAAEWLNTLAAWPPEATHVLTRPERSAYSTLVRALPEYMILAQVPLQRFIKVPKRHSYAEWLRRLGNQCVDLVICDMASKVLAVVDVQPPATEISERAHKRTARIAQSLKAAGVPMHIWTEGALPTVEEARDTIVPATPPPVVSLPESAAAARRRKKEELSSLLDEADHEASRNDSDEPPPSTWFGDFDREPEPAPAQKPGRH